jgi:hypothetical protein
MQLLEQAPRLISNSKYVRRTIDHISRCVGINHQVHDSLTKADFRLANNINIKIELFVQRYLRTLHYGFGQEPTAIWKQSAASSDIA